ncbi:MAG: hypothetical protein QM786_04920 [Breznakibacter sp.]
MRHPAPTSPFRRLQYTVLFLVAAAAGLQGQENLPSGRLYQPRKLPFRHDTVTVTPRWFLPDFYRIQFAGQIGFVSLGAGYQVGKRYEPALYLGFLNYTFGGSEYTVTTLSLKNTFKLSKQPLWGGLYPVAGLSVNWGYTENTFNKLPPHYDDKYYFQNKIHLAPFVGGQWVFPLKGRKLKAVGAAVEFHTLDAYLLEAIRTRYVGWDDIWNLSLGVTVFIH